jgi:ABC-type sugar transport system ATPase subunit
LRKLREHGVPMVLITHDPDDLAACADTVVTLADGRVVELSRVARDPIRRGCEALHGIG